MSESVLNYKGLVEIKDLLNRMNLWKKHTSLVLYFDDHEREYLEKIAQIVESYGISTFVPHRDAGLVTGDFTFEKRLKFLM